MADLKSINGVEVFAAGKWNGDNYTTEDLDEMVRAFNENKASILPSLKLGHDNDQKILQKDGYPAAGWINKLYRSGQKLVADFVDIPEKVYELVKSKAYRKVSSEIYWNIEINGRKYKKFLSAVAMLGEDMPAVGCLDDMLALYGVRNSDRLATYATNSGELSIKTYTVEIPSEATLMNKTEAEIKLELELKEAQESAKKFSQDAEEKSKIVSEKEKEIADLRKFKEDAEKRAAEAERTAFIGELEHEGLASPAMKPYVLAILEEDKKEYSIDNKKLSKTDLIKEMLKLHAKAESVNLSESSTDTESAATKNKESALDSKIKKYAADNKVTYGQAYKAVLKMEKK